MKTASVKLSLNPNQYMQRASQPAFTGLKSKVRSAILLGTIILGGTTTAAKAANSATKIPQKTLRQCNAIVSIEKYYNEVMLPEKITAGNLTRKDKKFNSAIHEVKRNCIEAILRDGIVPDSSENTNRIKSLIEQINSLYAKLKDYFANLLTK